MIEFKMNQVWYKRYGKTRSKFLIKSLIKCSKVGWKKMKSSPLIKQNKNLVNEDQQCEQEKSNINENGSETDKTENFLTCNTPDSETNKWIITDNRNLMQIKNVTKRSNVIAKYSCGDIDIFSNHCNRLCLSDEELLKRIKPCQDYDNKIKELKIFLKNNLEVADLKINLYIAACNKHCLSPYPSYIIEESVIGVESLSLINGFIPPVGILQHYLNKTKKFAPNEHVVNVLHWLLVTFCEPTLTLKDNATFSSILQNVEHLANIRYPSHVFVFKYKRLREDYWHSEKNGSETKFAFLPINLEQAHSIIHLGIHPQIYTEGIHGVGLYLTTDLTCCLESASAEWVWGKSMLGIETQVILQVEFIKDATVIAYSEKRALCTEEETTKYNDNNGKHYYVASHKLVRPRYLLLYVKTPPTVKRAESNKKRLNFYKQSIFYFTLTLTFIILAKRTRFQGFVRNFFANIASLPIVKQCLSIIK